ncbi:MAG: hypothetical protein A3G33_10330 [Omnitrophica bacterium RIFCSPLOWO2_12_FULL_44_17]|uniref:Acylneuraminate cytidylyltransferase n=1 Tax=Candidatus Danuiimicrobium aquiferis TaxID=1801832 RepID=A0A1G1L118_9BACT|nr:MAG: hypothetical protein A3B72_01605 [Omnitrophica bacterium RIFCSPHIGHO2_02_FULL_45_28]OGW90451.1 MAG: hypothetical protein A3E74_03540 [Omnitrophica bacterium RIFCSPHIGHO2_12_FULL_44_12]OGW98836.1 MAG: hypothetical protein A3G33_10330 [Omnitrophica bacterium RIFCSPLOWO2_12_FULL_44_17]OGX02797.1 MAG: hypothetical protein A3J12_02450 [Omnitrophica bacterium RIFCSPLOWO2_02_FULL_44_11]
MPGKNNISSCEVLVIIPARGGSKAIPRKNIKLFAGHPLIAYSIAAARHSKSVHRIIVSTDDPDIAQIARHYGAEVPFLRPRQFAKDNSCDFDVFQHAIRWLKENEKYSPEIIVQLRPTSPLRPPGLIDQAVEMFRRHSNSDSLRTVTIASQTPFKMWELKQNGLLKPVLRFKLAEAYNMPRQKLPPIYWQTGHVDVFWLKTVNQKKSLTGRRVLGLIVPKEYSVDIDTLNDWALAERCMQTKKGKYIKPDLL